MEILNKIISLSLETVNPYIENAIQANKKIMGYVCSYIPEEIIHAAGFIPYKMSAVGSSGTTKADIYFSPLNCTFVRHCFDKALRGEFSFLDGVIFSNGCDHNKRLYDNWRDANKHGKMGPDFIHMFEVPHLSNEKSIKKFTTEVKKLKEKLEYEFHTTIPDNNLRESILLYNKKRRMLHKIYERRKTNIVPIRGSEILSLIQTINMVPVEIAIEILEQLDMQLTDRAVSDANDIRVLITGGCLEEVEHIEIIEKSGAVVVSDTLCHGGGYCRNMIDLDKDPIKAIAETYLEKTSCPRMIDGSYDRMNYLVDLMKEYAVEAVIMEKLLFCDIWGGENYLLHQEAKRLGFPVLTLDRELYGGGIGQLRTRIQAFVEQVRNIDKKSIL